MTRLNDVDVTRRTHPNTSSSNDESKATFFVYVRNMQTKTSLYANTKQFSSIDAVMRYKLQEQEAIDALFGPGKYEVKILIEIYPQKEGLEVLN